MNIDPTKFKLIETRVVEHDNYLPSIIKDNSNGDTIDIGIFLNDIIQEYAKKDKIVDIVGIKTETRNLNFHNALTLIFVLNIYEPI